jgi:hypothetical protein
MLGVQNFPDVPLTLPSRENMRWCSSMAAFGMLVQNIVTFQSVTANGGSRRLKATRKGMRVPLKVGGIRVG